MEVEPYTISALLAAAATAIGVGMVLGGFAAGVLGLLVGADRDTIESRVLRTGYVGAAGSLAIRIIELATG